ncbi:hypothetical protein EZV62_002990 [Acer yangbiense]|uniref:Uncharacterized protein n=1 Tax=Acer yangbiense TaxID=1000413 RepID=A0A5C7IYV5_9ROSI|nr:hypothetical protein EZV62_002990 [Acer yangbiense]
MAKHHPDLIMCRKQPGIAEDFVRNVTGSVVDVLSAEEWEYLMPATAKNVPSKRKTGMVVQKLLIWGVPKQTCFTSVRNMVIRKDDDCQFDIALDLSCGAYDGMQTSAGQGNDQMVLMGGRSLKVSIDDYGEPSANRGHDPPRSRGAGQCSPNLPLLFTFADEYGSTDTAKKWLDRSLPNLNTRQLFEKHHSNYEDPQVLWAGLLEFRKAYDYLHSVTHQQLRNGTTMQRRHRHMRNYALNTLGTVSSGQCSPNLPLLFTFADEYDSTDTAKKQLFEKHRANYEDPQVLWVELLEFRKAYVDCYSTMSFSDDYLHRATHQQLHNGTTMQRRHRHMRNYALNTLGYTEYVRCSRFS